MSTTLAENDLYIAFVSDLYRRDPARVMRAYEAVYSESLSWPEGGIENAIPSEVDDAISALIEQDAHDGRDSWVFRDTFGEEGEAWAGLAPVANQG